MPASDGIYFEGKTTARREVSLDFAEEALVLEEEGKEVARWAYADIRKGDAGPDDEGMRITSVRAPESRGVEVTDKYLYGDNKRKVPVAIWAFLKSWGFHPYSRARSPAFLRHQPQ